MLFEPQAAGMNEVFVGIVIAAPVLAAAWVAWRILFVEDRETRDRRIKQKGPVRIMTEISPGLGKDFWESRTKTMRSASLGGPGVRFHALIVLIVILVVLAIIGALTK